MARRIPEQRFDELVTAATDVFIDRGYRLTQMADVAASMGVAKGTLYTYVESKEALFALCLRFADRKEPLALPETLPVSAPKPGQLTAELGRRLAESAAFPVLHAALATENADDPRAELEAVLAEQYHAQEQNHRGIKLIERAVDHPEVGPLWQQFGRRPARQELARYLDLRARAGQLRPVDDPKITARLVIEVIATWAMHIRWDPSPEHYDTVHARIHAIDFLVRGLMPAGNVAD
jgi:AcrR family transcriptional regulator